MTQASDNVYVLFLSMMPVLTGVDRYDVLPLTSEDLALDLKVLPPQDRQVIDSARWLTRLRHGDEPEPALLKKMHTTLAMIPDPVLREVLTKILEKRTALAFLRRRSAGYERPDPRDGFGFGDVAIQGRFHWTQPYFGLEFREPWIVRAKRLFDLREAKELEHLMLRNSWQIVVEARQKEILNRSSVYLYVLQWELVRRYCAHDAQEASRRVGVLVEQMIAPVRSTLFARQSGS